MLNAPSLHNNVRRLSSTARHMAVITLQTLRGKGPEVRGRINIENTKQLKQAGFSVGSRFIVACQPGMVEILKSDNGSNTIAPKRFSRRDGTEVIGERLDVRSLKIHEQFAGEEKVLAVYLQDRIVFLHIPTLTSGMSRAERLLQSLEKKNLRTAAFYSGIGTLDAALHEGFAKSGLNSEMAFANDSWPLAIDALLNDNPAAVSTTRTFSGGIEQFIASGMRLKDVDMAILGVPCKGASKLNIGTRDAPEFHPWAGHQVMNALMALQQMDFPPLVLIENVTAYADTASLSMMRRVLAEQGYEVDLIGDRDADGNYKGINSNDYGDIERRVRMALLAYPKGIKLSFDGMRKSGPSTLAVRDIRLPEDQVNPAEYEKGLHLNSEEKRGKGWHNRIVEDDAVITPTMSSECWKQRVEDPKFKHPSIEGKCRLPLPEEHAALKGHDRALINSLHANTHAHTALGNGTAKRCWVELARTLGAELMRTKGMLESYVKRFHQVCNVTHETETYDLFAMA